MKVKKFATLTDIWKLIDKDPSQKSILLAPNGVHVQGLHIGSHKRSKLPVKTLVIDGENLTGALKLFGPNAVIGIKQTDASLILTAGKRRAVLRISKAEPPLEIEKVKSPRFKSKSLRNAIPFLLGCTAGGVLKPILTGIRFSKSKGKIVLEATDGEIRYGRLALKIPVNAVGQVVPAADLEQALAQTIGRVSLHFIKSHLIITDGRTTIKLALLQGTYPDMTKLLRQKRPYALTLKKSNLETATKAAILLDSDRLVVFTIKDKKASWVIHGQETGGFRQPIGKTALKDIEITFDANWLEAAHNLGPEVKMEFRNNRNNILFTANKRSLYLIPIGK